MQLKRDTEYALRILFCLGEQRLTRRRVIGLTAQQISARSGVPKVGTDRICRLLEKSGLIRCRTNRSGDTVFLARPSFAKSSLLDVIQITEPGTQMFAVFDRSSPFYTAAAPQLQRLQEAGERLLTEITLGDLLPTDAKQAYS